MKTLPKFLLAALLAAALLPGAAQASGVAKLKSFLDNTRSLRAEFVQSVVAKSGRKPQNSAGLMMFQRPGKFRWQLEKPYPQLMVGDGEKFWIYDPELKQVTVKKMGKTLGATPAAPAGRRRLRLPGKELHPGRRRRERRPGMGRSHSQERRLRLRKSPPRLCRRQPAGHGTARQLRPDHRPHLQPGRTQPVPGPRPLPLHPAARSGCGGGVRGAPLAIFPIRIEPDDVVTRRIGTGRR